MSDMQLKLGKREKFSSNENFMDYGWIDVLSTSLGCPAADTSFGVTNMTISGRPEEDRTFIFEGRPQDVHRTLFCWVGYVFTKFSAMLTAIHFPTSNVLKCYGRNFQLLKRHKAVVAYFSIGINLNQLSCFSNLFLNDAAISKNM